MHATACRPARSQPTAHIGRETNAPTPHRPRAPHHSSRNTRWVRSVLPFAGVGSEPRSATKAQGSRAPAASSSSTQALPVPQPSRFFTTPTTPHKMMLRATTLPASVCASRPRSAAGAVAVRPGVCRCAGPLRLLNAPARPANCCVPGPRFPPSLAACICSPARLALAQQSCASCPLTSPLPFSLPCTQAAQRAGAC